jgi:TfoX/Sxy family transcriptional regulator of competence genes
VPFDEQLADRIRRLLPKATEKRMFGGMGLMENGNMVAGVSHDDLVVRVPHDETERLLHEPGAHEMMPGRPMKGWVKVRGSALSDEATLRTWVERSRAAMRSAVPLSPSPASRARRSGPPRRASAP